jgi:hypothetical protein
LCALQNHDEPAALLLVAGFGVSVLYVSGDGRPLVAMVAACYLLGAAVLLVGLPRVLRSATSDQRRRATPGR